MQLPVERTNAISLAPLYELLNLEESASAQEIRDAYIHLCRIWHPKAVQHWSNWGVQPNQDYIEQIYSRIKLAYEVLSTPELHEKYKKGELVIIPLEEAPLAYKNESESYLSERAKKPTEVIKPEEFFNLATLPTDLVLLFASFLPASFLARLAMTSRRMNQVTKELCWLAAAQSCNTNVMSKFLNSNPYFSSKKLGATMNAGVFAPESMENFCSPNPNRLKLVNLAKSAKQPLLALAYQRHGSSAEFLTYLRNNVRDLFVMSTLISQVHSSDDENFRALLKAIIGKISIFEFITLLPFNKILFQFLVRSISSGAQLPAPFKKREDFESTAKYFQYLIRNIHDLYIAVQADPSLINKQDENGQTLLFHPAINGWNSSEDELQWAVAILLQVPDIALELTDNKGNTFLHQTTSDCEKYRRVNKALKFTVFEYAFKPFVKFAVEHGFNFQLINQKSLTVLQLASEMQIGEGDDGPFKELIGYAHSPLVRSKIFSYALRKGMLINVQLLLATPEKANVSVQQDLAFLQERIFVECSWLKKFDRASSLTINFWSPRSAGHLSFIRVKTLQLTFLKIANLAEPNYEDGMVNINWLREEMIQKLIDKMEQSYIFVNDCYVLNEENKKTSEVISILRNDNTLDIKESALFQYLCSFRNSSTANAIKAVFEEELNMIIKNVYSYSNLITNISSSLSDVRRLLATKLLELEKLPPNTQAEELGDCFNKLTNDFQITDCEEVFKFLLIYRETGDTNISPTVAIANKNVPNWPILIEVIRKNALEKLILTSETMGYDQAIKYLTDCREFLIFNLPNNFAEEIGRTSAVVVIDNLKRQLEYERPDKAIKKLKI